MVSCKKEVEIGAFFVCRMLGDMGGSPFMEMIGDVINRWVPGCVFEISKGENLVSSNFTYDYRNPKPCRCSSRPSGSFNSILSVMPSKSQILLSFIFEPDTPGKSSTTSA